MGMMVISQIHARSSVDEMEFFNDFYKRNIRLIFYFANRYSLSEEDREDLVQDVVLRLMMYIPALKMIDGNYGRTAHYIWSATQSVFIDRIRREQKTKPTPYPDAIFETLIEDRLMSQRDPHTDAYWDVSFLKQRLAKRDWILLEGKYVIGYTDIELAEMLNCTKDSVRMILSRARKKARQILLENYIDRGESNEQ